MNPADGYLSLAALIAAKTTLLLLVAFASSFFARKTSASARHVLWALTFVFLLLIPGSAYLSFLQQRMSIPIAVLSSGTEAAPVTPVPPRTLRTSVPGPGGWNAETPSTSSGLSLLAGPVWALIAAERRPARTAGSAGASRTGIAAKCRGAEGARNREGRSRVCSAPRARAGPAFRRRIPARPARHRRPGRAARVPPPRPRLPFAEREDQVLRATAE